MSLEDKIDIEIRRVFSETRRKLDADDSDTTEFVESAAVMLFCLVETKRMIKEGRLR